ncbi:MAG: hypothetical protein AAF604_00165 [Acidobacteriota bacterium]
MRITRLAILTLALGALAGPSAVVSATDDPVDAVLAGHLSSLGGPKALAALDSLEISGTYTFNGEAGRFVLYRQRPDAFRLEIELGERKSIEAHGPDGAWAFSSRRGGETRRLEGDRARLLREEWGDFTSPLLSSANQVTWIAREDLDGRLCDHLRLTHASGGIEDWYLDAGDHTVVRRTSTQAGRRGDYQRTWYFEAYRRHDGVLVPELFEREDRQHVRTFEVREITSNPELSAELFALPPEVADP